MELLIKLAITVGAGLFTFLTRKRRFLAVCGVVTTIGGAVLTVLQIIEKMKALGWIS